MPRSLWTVLSVLLLISASGATAQPEVIVLDSFDDDVVGQPPGDPEVGSVVYYGTGTHTVTDDYGSPCLRSVDNDINDGVGISWTADSSPVIFETSFRFRIEMYSGPYPATQRFQVNTAAGPDRIDMVWWDNGEVYIEGWRVSFWSPNVEYEVRVRIDCLEDTGAYWLDGVPIATFILPLDCESFSGFSASSYYHVGSNVTQTIDDVSVIADNPIFTDGFEGGDTQLWSATVPPP